MSQGVGRMFCLPKTAWPPTCSIISGSDTVKAEILKCGKLPGCSVFCHPDGCKDETLVKFTATLEIPDKSDRSHVVL